MAKSKSITRARTPESVGVSSKIVNEFLKDAKEAGYEYHSLMVIRNGKVAVEWYNGPFSKDEPHSVYSVSKSFTSTAIGFAISEGLITLDTKLLDIFPDYPPKNPDKRFDKVTVRNLLRMSSGKKPNFLADKGKIDWIRDFIDSPWVFEPGEKFLYVNENIFMLSAIINRVTGMTMREYLTPRLFEPLGIDVPYWDTDQNGVEAGGWGLYIKTEDLAKFTLCYLQKGKYKGHQVIPAEWTVEATKCQINNEYNKPGTDSSCGYGYCFWKNSFDENSFRADGMFSQFGIGLPEYNAVIVITSSIAEESSSLEFLWKYFPRAFIDIKKRDAEEIEEHYTEAPYQSKRVECEKEIDNRYIKFRKRLFLNIIGFPLSVLPLAVTYMMTDRAGNIDMVRFKFQNLECSMEWTEGDETNEIPVGMDGHYRYGKMRLGQTDFKVCSNAHWIDERTLLLNIRPIGTVGKRNLMFDFLAHDRVTMTPSSTPQVSDILNSLGYFFKQAIPNKVICNAFQKILTFVPPIVEPKMKGRFVEPRRNK